MVRQDVDPRWTEMSASLRKGTVYVKLPLNSARIVVILLERVCSDEPDTQTSMKIQTLRDFLKDELEAAAAYSTLVPQRSLFYALPVTEAAADAAVIQVVEEKDASGVLRTFRQTLSRGAEGDTNVDWIIRVGGPKPDSPLEGLARQSEPEILIDLSEVFDQDS